MIVNFILVDSKEKPKLSKLFQNIDGKIAYISDLSANKIRFGLTTDINYYLYEDLIYYKEILKAKMCGSSCLCEVPIEKIISKINSLINQTC